MAMQFDYLCEIGERLLAKLGPKAANHYPGWLEENLYVSLGEKHLSETGEYLDTPERDAAVRGIVLTLLKKE